MLLGAAAQAIAQPHREPSPPAAAPAAYARVAPAPRRPAVPQVLPGVGASPRYESALSRNLATSSAGAMPALPGQPASNPGGTAFSRRFSGTLYEAQRKQRLEAEEKRKQDDAEWKRRTQACVGSQMQHREGRSQQAIFDGCQGGANTFP
ncbi:hypothetical protein [Burkholderia plantarii]|uniref:hypothetical protein n=1 Tax=Burkholderia plantarii TaxID=41899 RepID=UPI0018DCCF93|nr:hypothetical protein [Burkholderia plantarii]MBI0329502.1 hypothetical protein [Burkholderia plantarii]